MATCTGLYRRNISAATRLWAESSSNNQTAERRSRRSRDLHAVPNTTFLAGIRGGRHGLGRSKRPALWYTADLANALKKVVEEAERLPEADQNTSRGRLDSLDAGNGRTVDIGDVLSRVQREISI